MGFVHQEWPQISEMVLGNSHSKTITKNFNNFSFELTLFSDISSFMHT